MRRSRRPAQELDAFCSPPSRRYAFQQILSNLPAGPLESNRDRLRDSNHTPPATMADSAFKTKTMKRKNVKGLALSAPPPKPAPAAGDAQAPGGNGNDDNRADTLEIGVEFRLDLKAEDLIVVRELGSGNGGTVSKVQHAATKVVMARKVSRSLLALVSDARLTFR